MARLTLQAASRMVDAAVARGREHRMMWLTVAVLDAGGHLVALKREDGSGILRPDIAIGKAWGALGMGVSGPRAPPPAAARPPARPGPGRGAGGGGGGSGGGGGEGKAGGPPGRGRLEPAAPRPAERSPDVRHGAGRGV